MSNTRERQNEIAWKAQLAVAVLVAANEQGQPKLNLVDLGNKIMPEAVDELLQQGYQMFGVIGYMADGTVDLEPQNYEPLTVSGLLGAIPFFVQYAAPKIAAQIKGNSTSWLERLHALPDLRAN